jgi:hypothetical protein
MKAGNHDHGNGVELATDAANVGLGSQAVVIASASYVASSPDSRYIASSIAQLGSGHEQSFNQFVGGRDD